MLIAVGHDRNQPHRLRWNIGKRNIAIGAELDHPQVRILHRIYPLLAPRALRFAHFTPIRDRRLSSRRIPKTGMSQDVFETLFHHDQGNIAETVRVFGKAVQYGE